MQLKGRKLLPVYLIVFLVVFLYAKTRTSSSEAFDSFDSIVLQQDMPMGIGAWKLVYSASGGATLVVQKATGKCEANWALQESQIEHLLLLLSRNQFASLPSNIGEDFPDAGSRSITVNGEFGSKSVAILRPRKRNRISNFPQFGTTLDSQTTKALILWRELLDGTELANYEAVDLRDFDAAIMK